MTNVEVHSLHCFICTVFVVVVLDDVDVCVQATTQARGRGALGRVCMRVRQSGIRIANLCTSVGRVFDVARSPLYVYVFLTTRAHSYNKRQMSRIYPKGGRVDSSNYMPQVRA